MSYRPDQDLVFMQHWSNDDLDILVDIVRGKSDDLRKVEALTMQEAYKKYYPDHKRYWREIAEELQRFGGNSMVNAIRGQGVFYGEILSDVCDKLNVPKAQGKPTVEKESLLLIHLLEQSLEKMDADERKALLEGLEIPGVDLTNQAIVAAIQGLVVANGFASYKLAVIVANAVAQSVVGRGIGLAGNAALTRAIGVAAGPIGWIITGLWTAVDLAGPAYRVTIPACVHIAYIRAKLSIGDTRTCIRVNHTGVVA